MKTTTPMGGCWIVCFSLATAGPAVAAPLTEARVSQVIQDVRLLSANAAPRPAVVNDNVRLGSAVRTGTQSRAELTFQDLTITRLGENTVFSLKEGTRDLTLEHGSILLQVPSGAPAAHIRTAAVTAAISGGTAIFGTGPPVKFMVMEGVGTFYPAGHPEDAVTLHGGEMASLGPDGHLIVQTFNVKLVLETSPLITEFPDLANLPLILQVQGQQQTDQNTPGANPPPSKDIIDVTSENSVANPSVSQSPLAPPPTPPPTPPPATTVTYTSAPSGNWSNTANWNPTVVPNNGNGQTYNAVMSGGTLTQDISGGVTIQQLLMSGGTLILSNPLTLNAGLQFSGGTIEGGNLFIAGPSMQSALMTVNALTITNTGTYSIAFDGSDVFSGAATFNNSGTLSKTTGTGTANFNILLNNSGTVSSESGTLLFSIGGTSAGAFSASTGATVEFASNWTFTNGTHFSGAGIIQLDNNTTTFLSGTINNSGTVLLNAGANTTDLRIADGTMLTGGGSVILSDSPNNRIWGATNSGTETVTNVNNTISGSGQIGVGNSIEFINQSAGVIDATSATNALIITPTVNGPLVSANGGGFVNQGLLEATAAGGLVLNGGQFNNKGAMIEAIGSGNNVYLQSNVTVSGGTLSDSAGGLIQTAISATAFLDGTSQGALTIAGTYQGSNNSTTYLNGTINNTGTISIDSTANLTDLRIADGTTLTGGGSVILSDSPNNRIWGATNSGTETVTNVNNTISGSGQIGVSNSIEFINQSAGVINATSATNALIITPTVNGPLVSANGGGFVNQGLLEATAAGGLVLNGGQFNNKGALIEAIGSGNNVYLQSSVTVSGGTLSDSAGGLIQTAISATATLDGTSQGALTIAGTYQGSNNSTTYLNGTINNTGTISIDSTANLTDLRIADGTMLTGGGSVILSDSPNNRIWGATNSGTETVTNVNNTISGAGQIGVSNSIEFINQSAGVIDATSATNALIITPTVNGPLVSANGGGFVNQGLLEATAAGGLVLNGGQFNNKGALIEAIGSGNNVYLQSSVTVSGGTLSDSAGGLIQTAISATATLDGTSQGALTIAGTYQGSNNSTTYLNGTINNTGTISIDSTANLTDLRIADGTMLTGGGSVILSDSPNNRIWGATNSGTETVTNVNNTISGSGQIGVSNSIEFINQSAGVIDATSATNALIITPTVNGPLVSANGGGFVNQGLLEATAAGGLVLNGGQFNNKGAMIEAIGSGNNVYLQSNVTVSGGTLSDSAGGLIQTAISATATLDGTSQGALTIAGTYQGSNNSTTYLNGTINNTGTISIDSTANLTDLRIADGTMLTGGGSVILSDSPNNRIWGATNSGTETVTNVNNTISGAGQIGVSNSIEFINESGGVINANDTNALTITPTTNSTLVNANGGGFVNQGLLEVTGTGGLVLNGSVTSSGTVNVGSGSLTVTSNGSYTQTAGTFMIAGGTVTSSTNPLNFNGGLVDARGTVNGSINNNATLQPALGGININGGGSGLAVSGNLTLLSSSRLSFQLGGLVQGVQYGFINVNGSTALAGNLVLSFVNGFQNSVSNGNSFTLMSTSSAFIGSFANVASGSRLTTSGGEGSFVVTYSGSNLVLSNYVPAPAAPRIAGLTARTSAKSQPKSLAQRTKENGREVAIFNSRVQSVSSNESNTVASSQSNSAAIKSSHGNESRLGMSVRNSNELLSLLDNAKPGADGRIVVGRPLGHAPQAAGKTQDRGPMPVQQARNRIASLQHSVEKAMR